MRTGSIQEWGALCLVLLAVVAGGCQSGARAPAHAAGERAGRPIQSVSLRAPDAALDAVRQLCGRGVGAIVALGDPATDAVFAALLAGARSCGVPVLGTRRAHALGGALLTQARDVRGAGRAAGRRAAQALRGEDIGGLGFSEHAGDVLIVNADAAERDGVGLPLALIERADEVIGD